MMGKRETYFENIQGYKIVGGHFKLGSRIHITDYYYAKRLFYNSFFTNRFAFLISKYIIENFSSTINNLEPNDKITLIGYEMYSELLVSNIRKILNDKYDSEKFTHHIYKRDKLFSKNPNKINQLIILITPISTTFSTSLRIKSEITNTLKTKYKKEKVKFLEPYISCLVIGNTDSFKPTEGTKHVYNNKNIENEYGWQETLIDKGLIAIKPQIDKFSVSEFVKVKYFVPLNTDWVKTFNCSQCYPDKSNPSLKLTEEKVLIETDRNSLVPDLIFEYPRATVKSDANIFNLLKFYNNENKIVLREHFKKNNSNYIYYLKAGQFLKNNKEKVSIKWLKNLKDNNQDFKNSNDIVIITPTGGSNSGFVNLVNDKLFSDNATIIQFDVKTELIHNFQIFYRNLIQSADKIIFVDDVMATADSFSLINFYVKNMRDNKGVDYALCLINRLGYFNEKKLLSKLSNPDNLLCFLSVNVPPIPFRSKYPYTRLKSIFKHLANNSVLDMMQMHFKERESKFKPLNLNTTANIDENISEHKSLFQFLLEHELNNLFNCRERHNKFNYSEKEKIVSFFQEKNHIKLLRYFRRKDSIKSFLIENPIYKTELKNLLLKIFTIEPYIRYQNIKESAFQWVISDLSSIVDRICGSNWDNKGFFMVTEKFKYSAYHDFKFLLKRATKLNMNYIYSIDMLKAIRILLNNFSDGQESYSNEYKWDDEKYIYIIEAQPKPIFVFGFTTYYVALIQELIVDHESKAIELVKNIKKMIGIINEERKKEQKDKVNLRNDYNDSFLHLLRLLVLENTFILKNFSDKFIDELDIATNQEIKFESKNYNVLTKTLEDYSDNDIYIFQGVKQMLSKFNGSETIKKHNPQLNLLESFKHLIIAKTLIKKDIKQKNNIGHTFINLKIEKILELSCNILGISNGGAFLVLKYKGEENDKNSDNLNVIGEYSTSGEYSLVGKEKIENSIVKQMFDGVYELETHKPRSTFEVTFCNKGNYHYRKSYKEFSKDEIDFKSKLETTGKHKYENLFFLRIAKIKKDKSDKGINYISSPIAVLCFYNKNIESIAKHRTHFKRFDPKQLRLLLLLREDIRNFINHHLINDSLSAYVEEQKKIIDSESTKHGDIYIYQYLQKNLQKELKNPSSFKHYSIFINFLLRKLDLKGQILRKELDDEAEEFDAIIELKNIFDVIFSSDFGGSFARKEPILNICPKMDSLKVKYFLHIFRVIIFETLFNSKKETQDGIITIDIRKTESSFIISISNDFLDTQKKFANKDRMKLKEKGYIKKGIKGIYLNYLIFKNVLKAKMPEYSIDENKFVVTYNFTESNG